MQGKIVKVGIISSHLEGVKETTELGYETREIIIELNKIDIEVILIDPAKIAYGIKNNLAYAGFEDWNSRVFNITDISALLVRRTRGYEEQIVDFIEFAARANPSIAVIDPIDSFGRPTSKVESILRRVGKFNQPDTMVVTTASLVSDAINFPVIAKPTHGASGRSVSSCKNLSELREYLIARDKSSAYSGYGTLVQGELVIDAEFRVMVVDNKAIGCAIKKNGGNAARGATFDRYDAADSEKIMEFSERVSRFLNQDISGVDIIKSNNSLYLIECNRNPQFAAFDRALSSNVAQHISKMIVSKIEKSSGDTISLEKLDAPKIIAKPRIFVGSSTEGLSIAEELQYGLKDHSLSVLWTQGVFKPSVSGFVSLSNALNNFDYAIFCLTSDDYTKSRENFVTSPRDNVVFEAGLFMGALGFERVILLVDKKDWPKIPSDLNGLTLVTWESVDNEDLRPLLAPAILDIKRHLGLG